MRTAYLIGAAALALSSTAASAQAVGDWVLARWRGEAFWFPGVIQARIGGQVTIRYDDGTLETRPLSQVRPYDWQVGTAVTCRWTDGRWYPAAIVALARGGLTIRVRYSDGVFQTTQTGRCREE